MLCAVNNFSLSCLHPSISHGQHNRSQLTIPSTLPSAPTRQTGSLFFSFLGGVGLSVGIAMASSSQLTGLEFSTRLQSYPASKISRRKRCDSLNAHSASFPPSHTIHAAMSFSSSPHISISQISRQRASIGSRSVSCRLRLGMLPDHKTPVPLARATGGEPGLNETGSEQDAGKRPTQQHSITSWLLQAVSSSLPSSFLDPLTRNLDSIPPSVRNFPWPHVSKAVLGSQIDLLLPAASVLLLPALLLCSLGEVAYAVQAERIGWAVLLMGLAVAACHWAWERSFAWAKAHGYVPQTNKTPNGVSVSETPQAAVSSLPTVPDRIWPPLRLAFPLPSKHWDTLARAVQLSRKCEGRLSPVGLNEEGHGFQPGCTRVVTAHPLA